jgi:hypothetical protein
MQRACGAARLARAALQLRRAHRAQPPPPPHARAVAAAAAAAAAPSQQQAQPATWRFVAPTRRATTALAQLLADAAAPGDVLCLSGAVGAGKSFFWHVHTTRACCVWARERRAD